MTHQTRRRTLSRIAAITLGVALAACGRATGPDAQPVATYVLETVAGASLPVQITRADGSAWDLGVELVYLRHDGSFTVTTGLMPAGQSPSAAPGESLELGGRYVVAGAQITLHFSCATSVGCPADWVGTRTADRLAVHPVTEPQAERVYQRGLAI